MKENVALRPMDISFFGRIRIVFDADGIAQLVKKLLSSGEDGSGIGKSPFYRWCIIFVLISTNQSKLVKNWHE